MKKYSTQRPAKGRGEGGFGLVRYILGRDGISLTGWLARYFGEQFLMYWNELCNTCFIVKKVLNEQPRRKNA